jgi:tetratricopeptide (TPR) repeat protein
MADKKRRTEIVIERNIIERFLMKMKDLARENRTLAQRALLGRAVLIVALIALSVYIDSAMTDNQIRFEKIYDRYVKSAEKGDSQDMEGVINDLEELARTSRLGFYHDLTYYLMGNIYFDRQNFPKAKEHLLAFAKKSSSSLFVELALVKAAVAVEATGDVDAALNIYNDFVSKHGNSIIAEQVYFNMGLLFEKKKDFVQARDYYNRIISTYPQSPFSQRARKALFLMGSSG